MRLGRARLTRRSCIRLPLPAPLWLARYGAVPSAAATAEATRSCELNGMQSGRGGDVLCCEGAGRRAWQLATLASWPYDAAMCPELWGVRSDGELRTDGG